MLDLIARFLALPRVFAWLVRRAQRTSYAHIYSPDGRDIYMARYWLFNAYPWPSGSKRAWWREMLPSMRVHHIMRPDDDRHLHDHPWNARTFILEGHYVEEREGGKIAVRLSGTTARIRHGEYHRITQVSRNGVWTLFVTWKYRGTWGFKVDGRKVPWKDYLGVKD